MDKIPKKVVTMNVEFEVWDRFAKQSRDLNLSASERINSFMIKQIRIETPEKEQQTMERLYYLILRELKLGGMLK